MLFRMSNTNAYVLFLKVFDLGCVTLHIVLGEFLELCLRQGNGAFCKLLPEPQNVHAFLKLLEV